MRVIMRIMGVCGDRLNLIMLSFIIVSIMSKMSRVFGNWIECYFFELGIIINFFEVVKLVVNSLIWIVLIVVVCW